MHPESVLKSYFEMSALERELGGMKLRNFFLCVMESGNPLRGVVLHFEIHFNAGES